MVEYSFTIQDKVGGGMTALNQYVCDTTSNNCSNPNLQFINAVSQEQIPYQELPNKLIKNLTFKYKYGDECIFSFQCGDDNNVTLNVGNEIVQGNFYFYYTYKHPTMTLTLRVLLPTTFQTVNCNIKF